MSRYGCQSFKTTLERNIPIESYFELLEVRTDRSGGLHLQKEQEIAGATYKMQQCCFPLLRIGKDTGKDTIGILGQEEALH